MTTIDAPTVGSTRPPLGPALAAATASTVLLLGGLYLDTPWKGSGRHEWAVTTDRYGLTGLLLSLGFVAVGVALVFGIAVTRGLRRPARAELRWSLALAVGGLVSVVAFWTGLPIILASGAVVLALDARSRLRRTPASAWIVLTLAVLTVLIAVDFAVTG